MLSILLSFATSIESMKFDSYFKTYHILSIFGQSAFDINSDLFRSKIFINQFRGNETKYIQFEPQHPVFGMFLRIETPEPNIFSVIDNDNSTLFEIDYKEVDSHSLLIRGAKPGNSTLTGTISYDTPSLLTFTFANTDKSVLMRITPEKELTKLQLLTKLTPAICILFFYGFGRQYRRRFWSQFNRMNTATLQRHINQAGKAEK
ncbi:hypothetical protein TVAG_070000 [Trichomonas vaginalis G3]|uniref:Uncharacterized protein n=1 Tax=Trichomonas vaginalis (strain ATCC PRA-98 / G3) TaxID=412133 RepID=A2ESP1_TRIV3|nr:hypothetical protein TVAGG3_0220830 [Trichomonas vaginalis G3]EAY04350.1 hypothetical protein TVAG_070000 [Trichomonas vaginalis G3]KAI5551923.1 hypothetical protein TVAGG3_0220830 [Trichomonas vaginalis G3]|eukprot:XP_001316573.1 hypothetical protein [Trichomonas vaginalis G3]